LAEDQVKEAKNVKNRKKKMRGKDKSGKRLIFNAREARKERVHDVETR